MVIKASLKKALILLLITISIKSYSQDIFNGIRNENLDQVKQIVEKNPDIIHISDLNDMTPLHFAAYYGLDEIVDYLIQKGSDVNRQRNGGEAPIHLPCYFKYIEVVKLLVENGADINISTPRGSTPMKWAIEGGATEVVDYLVENGASIPVNSYLLHNAASHGMKKVIDYMLNNGVELTKYEVDGKSLLHNATEGGSLILCEKALSIGLDINERSRYGLTSLHFAALTGHDKVIKYLIDEGADVDSKTYKGITAYSFAATNNHKETSELLKQHTSNPEIITHLNKSDDIYFDEERPGLKPKLFALGIISAKGLEHGTPNYSPDEDEVYWSYDGIITYYMKRVNGKWTIPQKAKISELYGACNPVFSYDGSRIYFNSPNALSNIEIYGNTDIWYIEKHSDGWSEPVNAGENINSENHERTVSFADNGNMYFEVDHTIYLSKYLNGKYQKREKLGNIINTGHEALTPFIAPDESYLIFASSKPGGYGGLNLYVSFKNKEGKWSEAKNMGYDVNIGDSWFPNLSPDKKYLFFSNARNGNLDTYWVDAKIIEEIRNNEFYAIYPSLYKSFKNDNIRQFINFYNDLNLKYPESPDFNENMLNMMGYELLQENRYQDAIDVFALNMREYPKSGNVYDSYAEAQMLNGNNKLAIEYYEKSLGLDPDNDNAVEMIKKLKAQSVNEVKSDQIHLIKSSQLLKARSCYEIALGDIDKDGDLDAVAANNGPVNSQIFYNDGKGYFSESEIKLTQNGHGVRLKDIDGDNDLDIIMTCVGCKIYLNEGNGKFTDPGYNIEEKEMYGNSVHVYDIDTDGDLDIFVEYYQHDNILYLNDGNGQFSERRTYPEKTYFADLDNDGDIDYFIRDTEGYSVRLNNGKGEFTEHWTLNKKIERPLGDIAFGDIDKDGDMDALVSSGHHRTGAKAIKLFINDGKGNFEISNQKFSKTSNSGVCIHDLNNDGYLDAVFTNLWKPNEIWMNDGSGNLTDSGIRIGYGEGFRKITCGDIDNDGDIDVIFSNYTPRSSSGHNQIWFNQLY